MDKLHRAIKLIEYEVLRLTIESQALYDANDYWGATLHSDTASVLSQEVLRLKNITNIIEETFATARKVTSLTTNHHESNC